MKVLLLTFFDPKIGPKIFLRAPEGVENEELEQIPSLMDLYDEGGFFIHMFGNFKSANYIFTIPSARARGSVETLLISYVIDINSNINFELTKELLEKFNNQLQDIELVHEAFYNENRGYEHSAEKLKEVERLFDTFYKSFPKESVTLERKDAKILVFGLSKAGKTTIINCLKNDMAKRTIPTTYVDLSKIVINNISIYAHDTPGQLNFRDLWTPYLKNQDGLVFVLDVSDEDQFTEARNILNNILKMPEMENLPLLVLFNKIDLYTPNLDELKQSMGITKLQNRTFRCFLTCGLTNENIDKAFLWISEKLSERLYPPPKTDLGIIFSRWDESAGPTIIATYPTDAIQDPEIIAIRCFSISQFIFGGEKFKRVSVILPFTHLKAKASIYFDVVEDNSIRGGLLPLSLVIFFNERIPRAIIDQFNARIFEIFTQIKNQYTDDAFVRKNLELIYEEIDEKLKSVEPTVQILRIAEMRYQSLFMKARDAILIIDRKSGIIIDANHQAERIIQRPPEDIVGLHITQLQLEGEVEDFKEKILEQLEIENAAPVELKIKNPGGIGVPVEINASEVQMGGQNLIQCIIRDITERKIAEKKLKESENKYRHLFTNSPFSIILINSMGVVVDINPAIEQLLGYSRAELIDKRFDKLLIIDPKYLVILLEGLKDIKSGIGDSITILDAIMHKKDESTIWANIQTSKIQIGKEEYIQIITNDVTKQKEAEEALRESQEQYHKLYDRANFYKELFAQDVNNIFKKIQNSIESFKEVDTPRNVADLFEILDIIRDQGISGGKLVSNVRKLALIQETQLSLERIDLISLLQQSIKNTRSGFLEREIDLKIFPPNKKFYVRANEILLDVFDNVLINVIEYNFNPDVTINILISRERRKGDNFLKLEFIDQGIESSTAKIERIGLKKQSRGMLLGLTFVDQILTSLNGQFLVEGANFVIILPEV